MDLKVPYGSEANKTKAYEGAKKLISGAFPIDMHVDLYICLCSELKKIICVSHKNLILRLLVESEKSDIQLPLSR